MQRDVHDVDVGRVFRFQRLAAAQAQRREVRAGQCRAQAARRFLRVDLRRHAARRARRSRSRRTATCSSRRRVAEPAAVFSRCASESQRQATHREVRDGLHVERRSRCSTAISIPKRFRHVRRRGAARGGPQPHRSRFFAIRSRRASSRRVVRRTRSSPGLPGTSRAHHAQFRDHARRRDVRERRIDDEFLSGRRTAKKECRA